MNVKYIKRFGEKQYCKSSPFTIVSSVVSGDDDIGGPDILNRIEKADTWCMTACTDSIITKPIPNLH